MDLKDFLEVGMVYRFRYPNNQCLQGELISIDDDIITIQLEDDDWIFFDIKSIRSIRWIKDEE